MKNFQRGFVVPIAITAIIVLVIGIGIYFYNKNTGSPTSAGTQKDESVPTDAESLRVQRLKNLFPDTIGSYQLLRNSPERFIEMDQGTDCENVEDNNGTSVGRYCTRSVTGQYRENKTLSEHVVQVTFLNVTEGEQIVNTRLASTTKMEKLDGHDVLREFISGGIVWFPTSDVDPIFVGEQIVTFNSSGEPVMSGPIATTNNSVIRYFLAKFPPK